jgi:TonB family protein
MSAKSTLGIDNPHTNRGRWPCQYLDPLKLALLFPAALSLACAKPARLPPEAGQPPRLIWSPPVAYPPTMFDRGVRGRVLVQAMVDSTGRVEPATIEVVRATRPEFERPAVDMVRNSRFTPARSGTRALRRLVQVPVAFDMRRASRVSSADSAAAAARASQGETAARRGNITDAMMHYSAALGLDPRLNKSVEFWYTLCWHGTLWHHAADVMFACEQAVMLEPLSEKTREARGLARAITGDYEGAIEDLEESAARTATAAASEQRRGWIRALKLGQDPFTEDLLRALRQRPSDITPRRSTDSTVR